MNLHFCVGWPANEKTDHNVKCTGVNVSHTEPVEMKEASFSQAFYVFDNGYMRRGLAVTYSFNLSGNPEEPILFLLSGDVRGTAYCGAPSQINPAKAFMENIATERRSADRRCSLGRTLAGGTSDEFPRFPSVGRRCTSVYSKTNAAAVKASLSPFARRHFSAANRK